MNADQVNIDSTSAQDQDHELALVLNALHQIMEINANMGRPLIIPDLVAYETFTALEQGTGHGVGYFYPSKTGGNR